MIELLDITSSIANSFTVVIKSRRDGLSDLDDRNNARSEADSIQLQGHSLGRHSSIAESPAAELITYIFRFIERLMRKQA